MRPRDLRFSVVGREKHWTGRRKKILGEGKYLVVGRGISFFARGKEKKRRKKRKIKENIFLQRRRSTKRENEESI